MGVKMGGDVVKFTSRQKNGVPFGTPFGSFALKSGAYVLTRIGMITVVRPSHCRRRWMAKAVSLCSRRW